MKKHLRNRILCLVLAAVMVLGMFPSVSAASAGLSWKRSDVEVSWDKSDRLVQDEIHGMTAHKPTDLVRVSIVLEDAPTLKAGYSTSGIGTNSDAIAYDLQLQKAQQEMAKIISAKALGGRELDVVWNLTLASNIISANIPYGKLDAVAAVDGVREVVLERKYETTEVETNTYTSAGMIGATTVWPTGLTGAGTRVAIVDTGTDTDHQSFDNDAYLYALEQNARAKGMSYEEYVASLELLDTQDIARVLKNLNAYERIKEDNAASYYLNEKLPFGANYVDYNLTINHDWDNQGSHGSHVAGIAAANRYIKQGSSFVDARQSVRMSGVAPDAQIITMKVFGYSDGPYDSDYFAAVEDAIWLGCDSVNLSLGSGSPGFSENHLFDELLEFMTTTDTVVVMSAGNSGHWAEYTKPGSLYADGVSFQTNGSPGSYTNPLTVASVENDGTVGKYITVGDIMIVYTETSEHSNWPMSSLDTTGSGTDYEYVFIDGLGKPEDYTGIDLEGKIVFCSRGEIAFYEKANNAASLGAAAIVIYNNEGGVIGMDLSDYAYTAPCVSILQSDAAAVKAVSTRQTTSAGLVYYTGTVTVSGEMGVTDYNSEYYTMSSFSSWGVPGSLELKPEITAPGGMIYSVNGVDSSGTAYEMMSGTSMAAPQVTGMAALVSEYIQANELDEKTGLSVRELSQSLMMSTAVPLRQSASGGNYYSLLNQGAGLARVDLATSAESYVLVDGMADGKVKVELREDADRTGVYSFSFTIHNMNGKAMSYVLSGDLFTQDLYSDENGTMYLDTWTRTLAAQFAFSRNGVSLETMDGYSCDLNGDGSTNTQDADYLLEYLLGNVSELHADGDVNGDGEVTTYDAHVLLTRQTGTYCVDVPANGEVTVTVEIKLLDEAKEYLDTYYTTGAYIESFVYATPVNDSEGVEAVAHSIPVLGYYGSWSEPSMFDVGTYVEYAYGVETREPYLYEINGIQSNYMTFSDGSGNEYVFGGNPFATEDTYMPERNGFNNKNGSVLQSIRYTQIRNSGNTMLLATNADTGEVIYSQELGETEGAYYHVNIGQWMNTLYKQNVGLNLAGVPEGTRVNVSLVAAPEYYCEYDPVTGTNTADWDALADGAYLTTELTIDNTDPTVKNVELVDNSILKITAKDNEYIAAVALMNASGTSIMTAAAANQTQRGVEMTCELDLSYVYGQDFLVAVFDYAENVSVYEISLELDNKRPYFTAIDRTNVNDDHSISYVGMEANGTAVKLAPTTGRNLGRCAEYVEGVVFEITDDYKLYVGHDDELYSFSFLADLDPGDEWKMKGFNDLAYNKADGKLYGLFYSSKNQMAVPFLCTIDMFTGEMTVLGQMPIDANTIAIDGEGNFYSAIYGASLLYTYKSDVTTTGKAFLVGLLDGYKCTTVNSMAWDHNENELYWAVTNDEITNLLKVNPKNGKTEFISYFGFVSCGLYIAYESDSDLFAPTDRVLSVSMAPEASTLANNAVQLQANILPWNVSDSSLVWTSSNPSVATVDENGLVYGVSMGTAVITATSVLDSTKTASCTVTITALDKDLKCVVWDEEGEVWWSTFNTDTIPNYTKLAGTTENNLPVNATMMVDGTLYASTLDVSEGISDLYTVDPETFEMTLVGSAGIGYLDMTCAPNMGYGLAVYLNYVVLVDLETGDFFGAWEWSEGVTSNLVGITYYGSSYDTEYNAWRDYFLILDQDGNVYRDAFMNTGTQIGYFNGPSYGYVKTIGESVDYSFFQGFHFDGQYTYWTRFNEADNVVELIVWDTKGSDNVYSMGCFAEGVWPVAGLYTDAELSGTMALADELQTNVTLKSAELLTTIEPVELSGTAKGSVNAVTVKPMSSSEITAAGDVQVCITMPAEGTNGMMDISFDPAKLEPASAFGKTDAFAWKLISEGRVQVAFADGTALAADAVCAVVNFKALEKDGNTTVSVRYTELNEDSADLLEEFSVRLPATFVDVPEGSFYEAPVVWAVKNGITSGASDTTFNPNGDLLRAQFVTFLWRAAGQPEPTTTVNPFTDISEGDWYYKAVLWAVEKGITQGVSADKFGPFGLTNRAQAVTFLWRYLGQPESAAVATFTDVEAGAWYAAPINWAVENGVTQGIGNNLFGINGNCNRAQAVTFLYRALAA